jgi:hypothetical protein
MGNKIKKDINNFNKNKERHGYQEWYSPLPKQTLLYRGRWVNDNEIGYEEWISMSEINFYIR